MCVLQTFAVAIDASLMSGAVYNAYGWEALNVVIFPVTLFCMGLLGYLVVTDKSRRTA